MPRCLIAYFSQGGTTARVAESIASGLTASGYDVDLLKIDRGVPPDISRYDLIGIGSPVHYFRPPFHVRDFVSRLPSLAGRAAFVFILHGTYRGDAGNMLRRDLLRKGAREAGYFHARGADRFLGYLRLGFLFSPGHPTYQELARAVGFGRDVARWSAGEAGEPSPQDPAAAPFYRLERFLTGRWLVRNFHSRLFHVDRARCTACDICIKLCPVGNLRPGAGGRPVWGSECLLCLSCEAICPKEAIVSPVSRLLFRPFLRANVRRALGDPEMDHARVRHRKGRTQAV